jgi:hypothetical protein
MFIDAHTHRLLAEERAAELRHGMGAARDEARLPRALTALIASIADRRPRRHHHRTAAAGLHR